MPVEYVLGAENGKIFAMTDTAPIAVLIAG
jgi:hypothetical protein